MYYVIYKVTNSLNGMYYFGKHSTENLSDGYLGTGGKHYQNSIKKYGKDNFKFEVRLFCCSYDIMTEMEEYLSYKEDWINDKMCYNENYGGDGGRFAINQRFKTDLDFKNKARKNQSISNKGKTKSESHKKAISESNIGKHNYLIGSGNPMFGKNHKQETKQIISEKRKGKSFCYWVTNGVNNLYIMKNIPVPNGYRSGRTLKKNALGIFEKGNLNA